MALFFVGSRVADIVTTIIGLNFGAIEVNRIVAMQQMG